MNTPNQWPQWQTLPCTSGKHIYFKRTRKHRYPVAVMLLHSSNDERAYYECPVCRGHVLVLASSSVTVIREG